MTGLVMGMLALAIIGCSQNDKSPTQPQNTPPSLPSISFSGPVTNSQDQNAQQAKLHILTINGYINILSPFAGSKGTPNGNSWTWTYNVQTLTATLTATQQSDGSFSWKLVLNGTDPNTNITYNNWTALDGTTSAGGTLSFRAVWQANGSGQWWRYDANGNQIATGSWT